MYCSACGAEKDNAARFCSKCGEPSPNTSIPNQSVSMRPAQTNNMNSFDYYIKAIKNYAGFSGRARRSEYWFFFLYNIIISFVLGFVCAILEINWLSTIYTFALLIPGIAVGVRRMHDINKSGWFILVPIYALILLCRDGDQGKNSYGLDPKTN